MGARTVLRRVGYGLAAGAVAAGTLAGVISPIVKGLSTPAPPCNEGNHITVDKAPSSGNFIQDAFTNKGCEPVRNHEAERIARLERMERFRPVSSEDFEMLNNYVFEQRHRWKDNSWGAPADFSDNNQANTIGKSGSSRAVLVGDTIHIRAVSNTPGSGDRPSYYTLDLPSKADFEEFKQWRAQDQAFWGNLKRLVRLG